MKSKIFIWAPRALGIFFCLFISLFALDAFYGNAPLHEKILGFLIHLVPTYIFIIALLIAWKWLLPGGILYLLLGVFYILMAKGQHWSVYMLITSPAVLIGALFITNKFFSTK